MLASWCLSTALFWKQAAAGNDGRGCLIVELEACHPIIFVCSFLARNILEGLGKLIPALTFCAMPSGHVSVDLWRQRFVVQHSTQTAHGTRMILCSASVHFVVFFPPKTRQTWQFVLVQFHQLVRQCLWRITVQCIQVRMRWSQRGAIGSSKDDNKCISLHSPKKLFSCTVIAKAVFQSKMELVVLRHRFGAVVHASSSTMLLIVTVERLHHGTGDAPMAPKTST